RGARLAERWQPAEGRAREMAGPSAARAPPRRADQRRGRRREVRDSRDCPRAGGARRRVPHRLQRSAGGARAGGPDCRDAPGESARRDNGGRRRRRARHAHGRDGAWRGGVKKLWEVRELSTVAILALEIAFFTWYLWPDGNRAHPFLNAANGLLVLKYSSIYGIAAIGAAIVIVSGGVDLSPGAVIALAGVIAAGLFVERHWSLAASGAAGILTGVACGLMSAILVV